MTNSQFYDLIKLCLTDEEGERGRDKWQATPLRRQTMEFAARPLKSFTRKMCDEDPEMSMHMEIILQAQVWVCEATELKTVLESFKVLAKQGLKHQAQIEARAAAHRDFEYRKCSTKV